MGRKEVLKDMEAVCIEYESKIATEQSEKVKALDALKVEKMNVIKLSAEINDLRKMKASLEKVFNPK